MWATGSPWLRQAQPERVVVAHRGHGVLAGMEPLGQSSASKMLCFFCAVLAVAAGVMAHIHVHHPSGGFAVKNGCPAVFSFLPSAGASFAARQKQHHALQCASISQRVDSHLKAPHNSAPELPRWRNW